MHLRNSFLTIHSTHLQLFRRTNGVWRGNGRLQTIPPITIPKSNSGTFYVFWKKSFKLVTVKTTQIRVLTFNYRYCGSHEPVHLGETQLHINFYCRQSISKNSKFETQLANERSGLAFLTADLGHNLGSTVRNDFRALLRGKHLTSQFLFMTFSTYILWWYTKTWLSTKLLATQTLHCFAASPLVPNFNLGTLKLPDKTWWIRHLVT